MTMSQEPNKSCHAGAEDCAANNTVPMWLVVVFAVTFFSGWVYFDSHAGDFSAKVYAPYHDEGQIALFQPMEKIDPLFKRGEFLYAQTCSACHQPTGSGSPGQCPPLAGSDWVAQKDPARIIRIVQLGAGGPITVKGVDHSPSVSMTPMGGVLTDDGDLAAVLTYVRQSWGNKAPSVTAAQVKKVRAEIADRKDPWTAAELMKVPCSE
jgi:mono/diheme cytochrome c family protein